jgi:hypothetical protein
MVSAYVAEKRYVNFREMIRVADARSARSFNCRGVGGCIFELNEKGASGLLTAASVVHENEDENTVRSWLEYLVDMKGAQRERNATDVIGPAPGVTT